MGTSLYVPRQCHTALLVSLLSHSSISIHCYHSSLALTILRRRRRLRELVLPSEALVGRTNILEKCLHSPPRYMSIKIQYWRPAVGPFKTLGMRTTVDSVRAMQKNRIDRSQGNVEPGPTKSCIELLDKSGRYANPFSDIPEKAPLTRNFHS
jgi:hypothetical protein